MKIMTEILRRRIQLQEMQMVVSALKPGLRSWRPF
jgi:hypothetical protein